MRIRACFITIAVLLTAFAVAQSEAGSIEGVVTDATGATVPGVAVTITNVATGATVKLTTDAQGFYSFRTQQAGEYELTFQLDGFKSVRFVARISAAVKFRQNLILEVGVVTETVTVHASPTTLSTLSTTNALRAPPPPPPAQAFSLHELVGGAGGGVFRVPSGLLHTARVGFHTEEYGLIDEPGFAAVVNKPLSTFSIDVDTASYSNVRRFFHDGEMPPADAVRIEELINYFEYDYPEPVQGEPFSIVTEMADCPWAPSHQLVHIGLRSKPVATADLPPNNLVFLLDVSGSMQPANKLPLLRKAFSLLADQMRPQDQVAIVVYAGAAGMVLPPTSGSQKEKILDTLSRLHAGGSTAGGAGIRLAYKLARENFIEAGNNRVILATDGDFNVGVSSEGELVKMIEEEREAGVYLTVLGFGQGNLKDSKMEKLADNGNGNFAYIDNLLEARRVLVEQMGATLLTVAKDVKLQVEFNPAQVKAYRLIGYENRRLRDEEFNDDRRDAGDLGAGHSVTALYEVVPAGADELLPSVDPLKYQQTAVRGEASNSGEVLTVKLRYKPPKESASRLLTRVLARPTAGDTRPTEAFGFAAAVAEFGLLLRDSPHKGEADYDRAFESARRSLGNDDDGRRSEFLYLIKTAKRLTAESEISQSQRP